MASNNMYYRRREQPPVQPLPSYGVGRGVPVQQSQTSFSGGYSQYGVPSGSAIASRGATRPSSVVDQKLLKDSQQYVKYLKARRIQIVSQGREQELADEMEDIDDYLLILQDILGAEKYGEYAIKQAIEKTLELANLNPIDVVNLDEDEDPEETGASSTPHIKSPPPPTPPPQPSVVNDREPKFPIQNGPPSSSSTDPGRGRGVPCHRMNQATTIDPRSSTFVLNPNADPRHYQGAPQRVNNQFSIGNELGPPPPPSNPNYGPTPSFGSSSSNYSPTPNFGPPSSSLSPNFGPPLSNYGSTHNFGPPTSTYSSTPNFGPQPSNYAPTPNFGPPHSNYGPTPNCDPPLSNYGATPNFGPPLSNYGSNPNFGPNFNPQQYSHNQEAHPHFVDRQRPMSGGHPASGPQQQYGNPSHFSGMPPGNYGDFQPPRPSNNSYLPGIPDFDHTSDFAFGDGPLQFVNFDTPQYTGAPINQISSPARQPEQFHQNRASPPGVLPDRIQRNPDPRTWRGPSPDGYANSTPSPPAPLTVEEVTRAKAQRCFNNNSNSNSRGSRPVGPGRGGTHRNPYHGHGLFRPSSVPPKKPIKLNQPIQAQRQPVQSSSSSAAAPLPSNQIPAVPRVSKPNSKPQKDLGETLERVKNSLASKLPPRKSSLLQELRKQSSFNNPNFIPLGVRGQRPIAQEEVESDAQPENEHIDSEPDSSEESCCPPIGAETNSSKKSKRSPPVARKKVVTKRSIPKQRKTVGIKLKFPSKAKKVNETQNSKNKRRNSDADRSLENARKKQKVSPSKPKRARVLDSDDSEEDEVPQRPTRKNPKRNKTPKSAGKSSSSKKHRKSPSIADSESSSLRSGPSEVSTSTSTSGSSGSRGNNATSIPRASVSSGTGNQSEFQVVPDQRRDDEPMEFIVERRKRKKDEKVKATLKYPPPPQVQESVPRVIGPRDTYVNSGLAKIKIEPDYIAPVAVKPEPEEVPAESEDLECLDTNPDRVGEGEDDLDKQMEDLFNEDATQSDSAHIVLEEFDIPNDEAGDSSEEQDEEACPIKIKPIQSILENSALDSDSDVENMEETPDDPGNLVNPFAGPNSDHVDMEDMVIDPDIEPVVANSSAAVETMEFSTDHDAQPVADSTASISSENMELAANVGTTENTAGGQDVKNIEMNADFETVEASIANCENTEGSVENTEGAAENTKDSFRNMGSSSAPSEAEIKEESAVIEEAVEKDDERTTELSETIISITTEQTENQNEDEFKPEFNEVDDEEEIQILDEGEYAKNKVKSFVLVDLEDEDGEDDSNFEMDSDNTKTDTAELQNMEDSFEQSEIIIRSVTTLRTEPETLRSAPEDEDISISLQECTRPGTPSSTAQDSIEDEITAPEFDVDSRDPMTQDHDQDLLTEESVCASTIQAFKKGNHRQDKLQLIRLCYKDTWPCPFCEASYAIADVLSFHDHITTHTGELRVCCSRCQLKLPCEKDVKVHIEEAHEDVAKRKQVDKKLFKVLYTPEFPDKEIHAFLCDTCGCFQMRQESMMKHLESTMHPKEGMYRIQFFPWEEGDHTRSNITTPGSSGFNTVSSKIEIDIGEDPDEAAAKSAKMDKTIEDRMVSWLSESRKYLQVGQDLWEHYVGWSEDLINEPPDEDFDGEAEFPISARNPLNSMAYCAEYEKTQERIRAEEDDEPDEEGQIEGDDDEEMSGVEDNVSSGANNIGH